jgi:hypothetical protein
MKYSLKCRTQSPCLYCAFRNHHMLCLCNFSYVKPRMRSLHKVEWERYQSIRELICALSGIVRCQLAALSVCLNAILWKLCAVHSCFEAWIKTWNRGSGEHGRLSILETLFALWRNRNTSRASKAPSLVPTWSGRVLLDGRYSTGQWMRHCSSIHFQPHRKHCNPVTLTKRSMLFRETKAVYCANCMKNANVFCGQSTFFCFWSLWYVSLSLFFKGLVRWTQTHRCSFEAVMGRSNSFPLDPHMPLGRDSVQYRSIHVSLVDQGYILWGTVQTFDRIWMLMVMFECLNI